MTTTRFRVGVDGVNDGRENGAKRAVHGQGVGDPPGDPRNGVLGASAGRESGEGDGTGDPTSGTGRRKRRRDLKHERADDWNAGRTTRQLKVLGIDVLPTENSRDAGKQGGRQSVTLSHDRVLLPLYRAEKRTEAIDLKYAREKREERERLEAERPKTRGDCADVHRPCPYVGCKYNTYLDVSEDGALTIRNKNVDPLDVNPAMSCTLDIVDALGGDKAVMSVIGMALTLTRERVRQMLLEDIYPKVQRAFDVDYDMPVDDREDA